MWRGPSRIDSKIKSLGFDSRDRMYISDSAEGHLYRVFPDGAYRSILRPGLAAGGGLNVVARGLNMSLYVADTFTVKEYSPFSGRLRNSWLCGAADPRTELQHPFTISAYGRNGLLVTSWFDNSVQVWDPRTNTISSSYFDFAVPINAIEVNGAILVQPEGMAVGRDGKLVVVETGAQRLVEIDPTTSAVSIIASNLPVGIPALPETPPTWVFNGVATDVFGAIYLSLDAQNKLIKIWPLR